MIFSRYSMNDFFVFFRNLFDCVFGAESLCRLVTNRLVLEKVDDAA